MALSKFDVIAALMIPGMSQWSWSCPKPLLPNWRFWQGKAKISHFTILFSSGLGFPEAGTDWLQLQILPERKCFFFFFSFFGKAIDSCVRYHWSEDSSLSSNLLHPSPWSALRRLVRGIPLSDLSKYPFDLENILAHAMQLEHKWGIWTKCLHQWL